MIVGAGRGYYPPGTASIARAIAVPGARRRGRECGPDARGRERPMRPRSLAGRAGLDRGGRHRTSRVMRN